MPNVMKVLKDEITRLAKKQARAVAGPARKDIAGLRKAIAGLRSDVGALQRQMKDCTIAIKKNPVVEPAPVGDGKRMWVFGKGIRALRKKLGLSQAYFAKLIDVSLQSVALWERKAGRLDLRKATLGKIAAVRSIGAREAKRRLADMGLGPKTRGRKPSFDPVTPAVPATPAKPARAKARKAKKA